MATQTVTGSETSTYSAVQHLKNVMTKIGTTTEVLSRHSSAVCEFDIDLALPDISILVLNNVISRIAVQFYVVDDRELVREYSFDLADQPLDEYGPDASSPPFGYIPDGARVRLIVTPIDESDYTTAWLDRLGWRTGEALTVPEDVESSCYGSFASGGFGVERKLRVNPKFDLPIISPGKEYQR